jgi:hypothetical protein
LFLEFTFEYMLYAMNIKIMLDIANNISVFALLYCVLFSLCSAVLQNETMGNLTTETRIQRYDS